MSIGLINVYSTRNLGDASILAAIASMLPGGQGFAVVPDKDPLFPSGVIPVPALPPCQGLVSVGGDIFNNARPRLVTRRFVGNLRELVQQPDRTMVFGQSLPRSCRGLSFIALAQVWRRLARVVVRDRESHARLTSANVQASLSFDAAFALKPTAAALHDGRRELAAQGFRSEKLALLSVRSFDAMYPHDQEQVERRLGQLASRLISRGHEVAILIQSDADANDSDEAVAERLTAGVPGLRSLNLVRTLASKPDPDLLMGVLALANIVISVRYHTAILRLCAGRLPFVLSYSNKGEDLCTRLALPGCRLADFDPTEWVADIERTAQAGFDPTAIRQDVRQHFAAGLSAIGVA